MVEAAIRDNRGMTLIELLFALVILLVMSLALIQMSLTGIHYNMRNVLRDEAVSIAEMRMNQLNAKPFNDSELLATVATGTTEATISRTIRNFSVGFTPTRTITDLATGGTTSNTKQITISVAWSVKGQQYSHSMTTIKRSQ